MMTKLMAAF